MNRKQLVDNIFAKRSFLCVGLDTDIKKIPASIIEAYPDDPITPFNKAIIDATAPYCVAYKPNMPSTRASEPKAGPPLKTPWPTSARTIPTSSS